MNVENDATSFEVILLHRDDALILLSTFVSFQQTAMLHVHKQTFLWENGLDAR